MAHPGPCAAQPGPYSHVSAQLVRPPSRRHIKRLQLRCSRGRVFFFARHRPAGETPLRLRDGASLATLARFPDLVSRCFVLRAAAHTCARNFLFFFLVTVNSPRGNFLSSIIGRCFCIACELPLGILRAKKK